MTRATDELVPVRVVAIPRRSSSRVRKEKKKRCDDDQETQGNERRVVQSFRGASSSRGGVNEEPICQLETRNERQQKREGRLCREREGRENWRGGETLFRWKTNDVERERERGCE